MAMLSGMIVVSSTVFAGSTNIDPVGGASITYNFIGDHKNDAGYAQGQITVKANDSSSTGTYYLYWADDTKALEGYTYVDKLSVTTSGVSTAMFAQTAIPADATKLIGFKSSSEPSNKNVANATVVYNIPQSKRFPHKSTDKKYTFGSYSDIHIANDSYGSSKYQYDEVHWRKALDSAAARNVDFIVTGGDNVNNQNGNSENNYVSEWKTYQKILADSDYCNPIYESIGNHEMWTSASTATKAFIKATGMKCDSESLSSDKAYYTFDEPKTGDHFIIMSLEYAFNPKENDEFSTTQLNWVKNLLNKYKNDGHNTYIYEHAGFWEWGIGDDSSNPYYDIPLSLSFSGNKQLQQILYDNPQVMFFCGHTHIYFAAQFNYMDFDPVANKATAKMVHNSSIGGIRKPMNTTSHLGQMDRDNKEDETEGYFVDCYGDYIVCNGANLYYNLINPKTTYIVMGTGSGAPITEPSTPNPTKNYNVSYNIKSTAYLSPSNASRTVEENSPYKCTLADNSGKTPSENETYTKTVKVTMGGNDVTSSVVTSSGNDINKSFVIDIPKVTGNIVIYADGSSETKYALGNVNLDDRLDIADVTMIQKYSVKLIDLTDLQKSLADYNGDGRYDISDATQLQKAILGLGNTKAKTITAVGSSSSELNTLMAEVKSYLDNKYTYSSYDQYMAVKKEYRYCTANISKFSASEIDSHYTSLSQKYTALKSVAGDVSTSTSNTIYFKNTSNWSTVYAYAWTHSNKNASWPGEKMDSVGNGVYKITLSSDYENIIFNNKNGTQTGDLVIPGNNQIYDYSKNSWSAYN